MLDNNQFERQILKMYPNLTTLTEDDGENPDLVLVQNIENGDKFRFQKSGTINDQMVLESIHTPGHISDHISFLLKTGQGEDILFSGDIILDSPSTVVEDLPVYMKTLYDLRKVKFDHKFDPAIMLLLLTLNI